MEEKQVTFTPEQLDAELERVEEIERRQRERQLAAERGVEPAKIELKPPATPAK